MTRAPSNRTAVCAEVSTAGNAKTAPRRTLDKLARTVSAYIITLQGLDDPVWYLNAIGGTVRPTARHSIFLILLVLLNQLSTPAWSQQNPASLQIVIVEGEGALNNIKQRVNRDPIVQVEDENHKPIAGAAVVFTLPNQGPGGTFENGSNTLTTTTNNLGQAVARGIRFNNQVGSMQMRITASFGGQTATAVMTQTNLIGASSGGGGGGGSAT